MFYCDRSGFETGRWVSLGAFVVAVLMVVGVVGMRFQRKFLS
jgi:hypothetical protein